MNGFINIIIGTAVLILGIPIGNFLAKQTREELKDGQKWFRLIIIISLLGGLVGLIIGNDVLLFSFLFIAIITVRNITEPKKKISRKK
jgi:hypothetical protein